MSMFTIREWKERVSLDKIFFFDIPSRSMYATSRINMFAIKRNIELGLCLSEVIGIRNIWRDASFVLIGRITVATANASFSLMTRLRTLIK